MSRLKVLLYENPSFTDYSDDAEDFTLDTFFTDMTSDDYIYLGYYKPFSYVYVEFLKANTVDLTLSGEYWNGSAWAPLSDLRDRTRGFKRSQFIRWDLNQTSWASKAVDGNELYWVRFQPSADMDGDTELYGAAPLLSCDQDLLEEVNHIKKHLPSGKTSFVYLHQSARKDVLQRLNNRGLRKYPDDKKYGDDLNIFDILEPEQLRNAAKYFVLEKIYFNLSDNPEDKYMQKSMSYGSMAGDACDSFNLTVDFDDDGEVDDYEEDYTHTTEIVLD